MTQASVADPAFTAAFISMVESGRALPSMDPTATGRWPGVDQCILQTLMIPLAVVVLDTLGYRSTAHCRGSFGKPSLSTSQVLAIIRLTTAALSAVRFPSG